MSNRKSVGAGAYHVRGKKFAGTMGHARERCWRRGRPDGERGRLGQEGLAAGLALDVFSI